MKIRGDVSGSYTAMAARQRRTPASAHETVSPVAQAPSAQVRTHDFSHITSHQMKSVAKGLFDTGKIGLSHLFLLDNTELPLGKPGPNGEFVAYTPEERESFRNTPMNYMDIIKDVIGALERQGKAADPTSGYQSWRELLGALEDSQGAVSGIDVRV